MKTNELTEMSFQFEVYRLEPSEIILTVYTWKSFCIVEIKITVVNRSVILKTSFSVRHCQPFHLTIRFCKFNSHKCTKFNLHIRNWFLKAFRVEPTKTIAYPEHAMVWNDIDDTIWNYIINQTFSVGMRVSGTIQVSEKLRWNTKVCAKIFEFYCFSCQITHFCAFWIVMIAVFHALELRLVFLI